jgi:hypothetical protein
MNSVSIVLVVETICCRLARKLGGEYATNNALVSKTSRNRSPMSRNSCHRNRTPIEVIEIATLVKKIPCRVTPQIPRAGLQLPELFAESRHQQMTLLIDEPI